LGRQRFNRRERRGMQRIRKETESLRKKRGRAIKRKIRIRIARRNIKSPPELSLEQGLNGGWEFAKLSFPR
jgi:hypothetical protein